MFSILTPIIRAHHIWSGTWLIADLWVEHAQVSYRGWKCSSVVEHRPSMHEVLGSIPSTLCLGVFNFVLPYAPSFHLVLLAAAEIQWVGISGANSSPFMPNLSWGVVCSLPCGAAPNLPFLVPMIERAIIVTSLRKCWIGWVSQEAKFSWFQSPLWSPFQQSEHWKLPSISLHKSGSLVSLSS